MDGEAGCRWTTEDYPVSVDGQGCRRESEIHIVPRDDDGHFGDNRFRESTDLSTVLTGRSNSVNPNVYTVRVKMNCVKATRGERWKKRRNKLRPRQIRDTERQW